MKTAETKLTTIKDSGGWADLIYELRFDEFAKNNPTLDKDELADKFYTEITSKVFEYGEYADLEIVVDENLNIVGGKILPFKQLNEAKK